MYFEAAVVRIIRVFLKTYSDQTMRNFVIFQLDLLSCYSSYTFIELFLSVHVPLAIYSQPYTCFGCFLCCFSFSILLSNELATNFSLYLFLFYFLFFFILSKCISFKFKTYDRLTHTLSMSVFPKRNLVLNISSSLKFIRIFRLLISLLLFSFLFSSFVDARFGRICAPIINCHLELVR